MASELMDAFSGRRFGGCEVTLRPCRRECADAPWAGGVTEWPGAYGRWFESICGGCRGPCSCVSLSEIVLPVPVSGVGSVVIDDVTLSPTAYRVDDHRLLVRQDGGSWPSCNNLSKASGPGTWSVTAAYGLPVPVGGQVAVGELACEIIRALKGEDCRLPKRMTALVRQGVTVSFPDTSELLDKGLLGLPLSDWWLSSVNPNHLKRRSRVYRVDNSPARRKTS